MFIAYILLLSIAYTSLSILCITRWRQQRDANHDTQDLPHVSIIIIARNESEHIAQCLQSISNNDYPREKFEIILVNDHSQDNTVAVARKLNISNLRILELTENDAAAFHGAYKKAGQHLAIQYAKYDVILQTDGDCICPPGWIRRMSAEMFLHDLATGVIALYGRPSKLTRWQVLDNILTMMGTMVGINSNYWFSANAANMVYKRSLYQEFVKGDRLPRSSGDDIFLIDYAVRNRHPVSFVKDSEAMVKTSVELSLSKLIIQRKRWASKTTDYRWNGLKLLAGFNFIYQLTLVVLLVLGVFFSSSFWPGFVILLIIKFAMDHLLLRNSVPFFNDEVSFVESIFYSLGHVVYIIYFGLSGIFFPGYSWKGRNVR